MTLGDVILISCIMTTWIIMLISLIVIFVLKVNNDDTFKTKVVIHKHKNIDEETVPKYVEESKVYTDNTKYVEEEPKVYSEGTKYVEEPNVYSEGTKYEEINDGK